jgi:hypothetical protein
MSRRNSTGNFLPYYIPLTRGNSKGKKRANSAENLKNRPTSKKGKRNENKCASKGPKPRIKIKRKRKPEGKPQVSVIEQHTSQICVDDPYDSAVELHEAWLSLFLKTHGVPYKIGTEAKRLQICGSIIESLGSLEKSKAFMTALLTHTSLDWVEQKTLEWLAKGSNQTRVAPLLKKRRRGSRAEYSGERSTQTKIVFRSI